MSVPSYICFYTPHRHTEFRWIMTKAVAVLCENDDISFTETIKSILEAEGFGGNNVPLQSDSFRVVDGLDLSPEINENSETEVFYTYRQWMFSAYPEWFANPECRTCRGNGVFNESHGNAGWLGESLLCDCCSVDNDNDLLRRNP